MKPQQENCLRTKRNAHIVVAVCFLAASALLCNRIIDYEGTPIRRIGEVEEFNFHLKDEPSQSSGYYVYGGSTKLAPDTKWTLKNQCSMNTHKYVGMVCFVMTALQILCSWVFFSDKNTRNPGWLQLSVFVNLAFLGGATFCLLLSTYCSASIAKSSVRFYWFGYYAASVLNLFSFALLFVYSCIIASRKLPANNKLIGGENLSCKSTNKARASNEYL